MERKTGNIAIESFIIGKDINKWRHEFIDNETTPHCDINGKVIYSPMFGTLVDEHDDTIVRAKNEHEAGHARYTSCNKKEEWSELKSNIVNSLEDLRIEKNISCLSDMICYDLNYLNNDLSLSIGKKISQCNNIKPINEALLAMQLKDNGNSILWKISDKAQEYIDNVYSEYKKWKNIKNFDNKFGTKEIEKLADIIIEKLKETFNDRTDKSNYEDNKSEENSSEENKSEDKFLEDFDNVNFLENEIKNKFDEIMKKSKNISSGYTSFTENDIIVKGKEEKEEYYHSRNKITSFINRLSNYTEDCLKSLSRSQIQHNLESGKIDKKKLVGLSKSLTKKVFYKTKNGIDLNTAVTIMVDESGSIDSMCEDLRSLAIVFSEVFSKLDIKFEVLGFTTHNDMKVVPPEKFVRKVPMKIIEHKSYNQTYQQSKYQLGSITSERCNVDGESLLIAYKRIKKEKANRRIIFVLSDGTPNQGYGYNNIENHLKDSISFVRKNGVEVYGFGIGTNKPKYFYGEKNFIYLRNISQLGSSFLNKFKEVISN